MIARRASISDYDDTLRRRPRDRGQSPPAHSACSAPIQKPRPTSNWPSSSTASSATRSAGPIPTAAWRCCSTGRAGYREALEHAQQALSLCREDGERLGQAGTLDTIGRLHAQLGDYQQALTYCQESLELQRVLGDPHLVLADHDAARNTWEQARTILEDLQHSDAEGGSVAVGVVVPAHRGRFGGRRGRSGTRHHE